MSVLDDYLKRLSRLRVHKSKHGAAPHKPCLLLAILDLIESGEIPDGKVRYEQILETGFFPTYFSFATGVDPENDSWRTKYRPYEPFWHLTNAKPQFWELYPRVGREWEFHAMPHTGGKTHSQVLLNVDHAELEPQFFQLLCDAKSRYRIRRMILETYFDENQDRKLWQFVLGDATMRRASVLRPVRDPVFREAVIQAYGGTCAATGEKIVVPRSGQNYEIALIEAAHIIPHNISYNNDPRNGIALQPTYHKAMDAYLIAPGDNWKWHVSDVLLYSFQESQLCTIDGQDIVLPEDARMYPRKEYLRWRVKNLLSSPR